MTPVTVNVPTSGGVTAFDVVPDAGCGIWPIGGGGQAAQLVGEAARTGASQVVYHVAQNLSATLDSAVGISIAGLSRSIVVLHQTQTPLAPTITGVEVSGSVTTIDWQPSSDGPVPSGFIVEAGAAGGPISTVLTGAGSSRSMVVPTPPAGEYVVQVKAVNAVGEGPASRSVRVSVEASAHPNPPISTAVDVQGAVLTVTWSPAPSGPAPERFLVQAARPEQRPGASFFTIGRVPAGGTAFSVGVPPAFYRNYLVRVVAENAAGWSDSGPQTEVEILGCTGPPGAPSRLEPVVTGSLATLTWSAPTGGAEGFVIEVGTQPGLADVASLTTSGPDLSLSLVAPVSSYFVQVRGRNLCSVGPASSSAVAFVLWEPPFEVPRALAIP